MTNEHEQLQTKFTPLEGQDVDNLPYNAEDSIEEQVRASVASSLHHFRTGDDPKDEAEAYIDCVVLHSPLDTLRDTLLAWQVLEEFVPSRVRCLGLSNTGFSQLELLFDLLDVKPRFIQNRFSPGNGFDRQVRNFCIENNVIYQAFGVVDKHKTLLNPEPVQKLAEAAKLDPQVALYCLILSLENTVVLNGTKNVYRMKGDLSDLDRCRRWVASAANKTLWQDIRYDFLKQIGSQET